MDINSKINWQPGLEVRTATIRSLYEDLNAQQLMTVRAALGIARLGILPGEVFDNQGSFVKNTFEMPRLQCRAMLPSGLVLDIDEPVSIEIPMLPDAEYYLAAAFGQEKITFEHQGVPYERPVYVYTITTLADITEEMFPLVRFKVEKGIISRDDDYIPPTLLLSDNELFEKYATKYLEHLDYILTHPNMDKDFGHKVLLNYKFQMKSLVGRNRTADFLILTKEIVLATDFFIVSQVEPKESVEIPEISPYDVQHWLSWLESYLSMACTKVEKIEHEDNAIDVEALKEEIKNELYEKLYNDLYANLLSKVKEELSEELTANLQDALTRFVNEQLKPAILEELKAELSDALYEKLYQALYDALFEALNIPRVVEEEDTYMPLI